MDRPNFIDEKERKDYKEILKIPICENHKKFKQNFYLNQPKDIDKKRYLKLQLMRYENERERARGYAKNALVRLQDVEYNHLYEEYDILEKKITNLLHPFDLTLFKSGMYKHLKICNNDGTKIKRPLIELFPYSLGLLENEKLFNRFLEIEKFRNKRFKELKKTIKVAEQNVDFIKNEIDKLSFKNTQQPIESFEIPEYDYSGKNELKPKEKLILLDKLGIVKLLNEKLTCKENAAHLAVIIGAITGIPNPKGSLKNYCSLLLRPDDDNPNSPRYSKRTVDRANQVYKTFRINADE